MRILLYGFGPYRQFRDNITAQIIRALPAQVGLKNIIFPVRFQRRQFIDALNRHRPDVILGLGQSTRKQIEVETRARNSRRARELGRSRPIFKNRPLALPTTLAIHPGRWAEISKDAGEYVCNYSMFVLLDEISRTGMKTHFGFIHIPYDYDQEKARRYVQRSLKKYLSLAVKTNGA